MKRCEGDPAYKIDMAQWHSPINGECHVCMAGAVMSQTLGVKADEMAYMGQPEFKDNENRLMAFDTLRCGSYYLAFEEYTGRYLKDKDGNDVVTLFPLPAYRSYVDDKMFYEWCLAVADALEKMGE